jgi:hypothetical protein
MRKVAMFGFVLLASTAAHAQDAFTPPTLLFPGSLNMSVGTIAPSEKGNVITNATTEQGVDLWRRGGVSLVAHVDVTLRRDTAGNGWNNNTPMVGGLQAVAVGGWGVAQVGVGANVLAARQTVTRVSRSISASYWTGWRGDSLGSSHRALPSGYPGSAWASSGYVTAAEPDNWITSARIEQGATVLRGGRFSTVAFVGLGANRDTDRFGWNNRTQMDAGVKVSRTVAGGVVNAGVAQRREMSRLTNETRVAPVFFVDLWFGWNGRYTRHN